MKKQSKPKQIKREARDECLEDNVRHFQTALPLQGFDVEQRGVVDAYTGRLLMTLDEYLERLKQPQGFGLINLLCRLHSNPNPFIA